MHGGMSGATLRLPDWPFVAGMGLPQGRQVGIPNEIALLVGYDKLKQMCHVVWRSDTRLGVEIRVA
jgi:hypothetical protein